MWRGGEEGWVAVAVVTRRTEERDTRRVSGDSIIGGNVV